MEILKELEIGKDFQVNLQKDDPVLLRRLIGVGLIPNKAFKVLFKLTNGVIVVGDQTLKIAVDGLIASKIAVNLI